MNFCKTPKWAFVCLPVFFVVFTLHGRQLQGELTLKQLLDSADYYLNADLKKSLFFSQTALRLFDGGLEHEEGADKVHLRLCKTYFRLGNNDSALYWADRCARTSKDTVVASESYSVIGAIFSEKEMFDSAVYYLNGAIYLDKSAESLLRNYGRLGVLYKRHNKGEEALAYYHKVLDLTRTLRDSLNMARTYINIGNVFYMQDNRKRADESYLSALQIINPHLSAYSYVGMHIIYGNFLIDNNRLEDARYHLNKVSDMVPKLNSPVTEVSLLGRLGNIDLKEGKYEDAVEKFTQSLQINERIGDSINLYYDYTDLSMAYLELKSYGQAKHFNNLALQLARKYKDLLRLEYTYLARSKIDSAQGRYDSALVNYKLHYSYRDSLLNIEKTKAIDELDHKYDAAEKERVIAQQALTLNEQKRQMQLAVILLIIVIAISIVVFLYFRVRNKIERQRASVQLVKETVSLKEKIQQSIARDLHDSVGQSLVAAKLSLESLVNTPGAEAKVKDALKVVNEAYRELLDVSHQLMPVALEQHGLARALNDLVTNYLAQKIPGSLFRYMGPDARFGESVEINLYRIGQELVNNIIKHSKASYVQIQLYLNKGMLILLAEDNGVGFQLNVSNRGLGIQNMKTRTELLNGTMHIDSKAGAGTAIIIKVPVHV